ncbi:S-layer homology domain-containing protein [Paenibacillus oryzisoli]|uniref:SLH domain-containing protein n=1 Tax=Paenibacillus oryzisoli TaxID=1850517 RepID=A0A198A3Z2_9BACL|nr:S-layer homology domain-containing protein [Paenibacillus oryzisoli]OAS15756.1 hypothetical protein A8708_32700 [Paenibacillus oryzisoli]
MNWKKVVLLVTATMTLLAAIPAHGSLAVAVAASDLQADAEWGAAPTELRVGDTVTLALKGMRLSNLIAFEAFVEIDPVQLALVEAKAGWHGFDALQEEGTVLHFASTLLGKQAGVSGIRTLSEFKFKIKQAGDITLKLKKIIFVDSSFRSVAIEKDIELHLSIVNSGTTTPEAPVTPILTPPVSPSVTPAPSAVVPNTQVMRVVVNQEKADEYLRITASQSGLPGTLRPAGELVDVQFTANESTEIVLPVKNVDSKDTHMLGVYFLDTNSHKWVYVGGKLDKDRMEMSFEAKQSGMYAIMAYDRSFLDVSGHWARALIEQMAAKHIAQGTGMDAFEPDAAVSRASFAAFLVRSLGMTSQDMSALSFPDVKEGTWFYPVIATAIHHDIIDGDSGTIRPEEPITREEMIVMLMHAYSKVQGKVDPRPSTVVGSQERESAFDDAGDIAAWSLAAVKQARALDIIEGAESNRFFPKEKATRAESMAVILRLLAHM